MKGKMKGILLLLVLCLLTGCGKTPVEEKPQETPSPTPEPLIEFDWKNQEWKSFEEATEGTPRYIKEYIPLEWEVPEFEYTFLSESYANYGGDLYLLQEYSLEDGMRYFLHKLDGDTKEKSCMELDKEELGITYKIIVYMQVVSDEEIVFFAIETENTKIIDCIALHMSMEGKLLYETSLYPFYEGHELLEESPLGIMLPREPFFDNYGNSYYLDMGTSEVFMIDKEGKETLVCDYSNDKKVSIQEQILLPDGTVAFSLSDYNEWVGKLLWMDGESTVPKTLASISKAYFNNACVTEYGYVYYVLGNMLYRWNIRTGVCESIFSFSDNGISDLQWVFVDCNEKGEVLLYQYGGEEKAAYVLSPGELGEGEKNITIASLAFDNNYLQSCAASYSRKHPGIVIKYEKRPGEMDATRTRILADMSNGGGPDMLWVSAEDMRLLQEKGMVADLSELIEPEALEGIFDGIIASGTINGEFVGLVTQGYAETVFTANTTWPEAGWSALDILGLMEEKQDLEGLFCDATGNVYPGKSMLYNLVCYDMTDSPFIDFEKGESHFDRKEFVQILELTKQYTEKAQRASMEAVQEGQYLGMNTTIPAVYAFCEDMRRMGEECHPVGQPSEKKYVGNWICTEFLVVNKNSQYKEDIAGYLEELLSLRNQRKVQGNTIHRKVVEESMFVPEWDTRPHYKTSAGSYIILEAKPDGTPYFEEYLNFLENCGPMPFRVEAISDIIMQEAELFYNGVQDATKTADNIDSRVQLYLDEQK